MKASNVLLLPGLFNSAPDHWQSHWERAYGYVRVEQHDWERPLRGDWMNRLEEVLLDCDEPAVLVAHSLGCLLTAAWAAHSRQTARVKAALLVAPPDVELPSLQAELPVLYSWSPVVRQRLPFPSLLLGSQDDPYCSLERAQEFAQAWGSEFMDTGKSGHINAETGFGPWTDGHSLLQKLIVTC